MGRGEALGELWLGEMDPGLEGVALMYALGNTPSTLSLHCLFTKAHWPKSEGTSAMKYLFHYVVSSDAPSLGSLECRRREAPASSSSSLNSCTPPPRARLQPIWIRKLVSYFEGKKSKV